MRHELFENIYIGPYVNTHWAVFEQSCPSNTHAAGQDSSGAASARSCAAAALRLDCCTKRDLTECVARGCSFACKTGLTAFTYKQLPLPRWRHNAPLPRGVPPWIRLGAGYLPGLARQQADDRLTQGQPAVHCQKLGRARARRRHQTRLDRRFALPRRAAAGVP